MNQRLAGICVFRNSFAGRLTMQSMRLPSATSALRISPSPLLFRLLPGTISPYVIRAMGEQAARRYFVTAERFSATRAQALGFVHEVCTLDALDAKVDEIVASLVDNGPMATRACKRLVQDVAGVPLTSELREETARRIADIRASDEGREGVQAFLNKRKPTWLPEK